MSYTSFKYRMGAGFAGDVNRTHPVSIEPARIDTDNPPLGFGLAVMVDTADNSVRQVAPGDNAATAIYGITVRPFPFQQTAGGMSSDFNSGSPPVRGIIDVVRSGYIMGPIVGDAVKGGQVYVWIAASNADHLQGGFETEADGANTIALTAAGSKATFNGPADANGIGEIVFNV